jgi:hypothetical protein
VRYLLVFLSVVALTRCGVGDVDQMIREHCGAQFAAGSDAKKECFERQGAAASQVRSIALALNPESDEYAALGECMEKWTASESVDWVKGLSCYRSTEGRSGGIVGEMNQ